MRTCPNCGEDACYVAGHLKCRQCGWAVSLEADKEKPERERETSIPVLRRPRTWLRITGHATRR